MRDPSDQAVPRKPSEFELWLVEAQPIMGLVLHYVQTGTDTAETRVDIISNKPKKQVLLSTLQPLIDFRPDWIRLVQVKDAVVAAVEAWRKYEKANERDLAEYKRLKTKFGG